MLIQESTEKCLGEGDIYADTGINREILQLKVRFGIFLSPSQNIL